MTGTVTGCNCVFKRPFHFSLRSTASGREEHGQTVDPIIKGTPPHFSGCDLSFLVPSNTVWTIVTVDKDFYKSTGDMWQKHYV